MCMRTIGWISLFVFFSSAAGVLLVSNPFIKVPLAFLFFLSMFYVSVILPEDASGGI